MIAAGAQGNQKSPWVTHCGSGVAVIAGALVGAHDERYERSWGLINRIARVLVDRCLEEAAITAVELSDIVRSSFMEAGASKNWGMHLGLIQTRETRWEVYTIGHAYCARWPVFPHTRVTEPCTVARRLMDIGVAEIPKMAHDIVTTAGSLSIESRDFEYASVERAPGTGLVLLSSSNLRKIFTMDVEALLRSVKEQRSDSEMVEELLRATCGAWAVLVDDGEGLTDSQERSR
jgi:hypothetical protein